MGLDAVVFCDCVEERRLKYNHPFPNLLYIAPNGCPEIRSRSQSRIEQHDAWMKKACRHEDMMVAGDFLGNISFVAFLREALGRAVRNPTRDFPVLWRKVIYSGSHCGDHLTIREVTRLSKELERVRKIDFAELRVTKDEIKWIKQFLDTLTSIVKVAVTIKKPVAF